MGLSGQLKLTPNALWLRISENCNLRCVGCYVEGKFKKKYLSLDDVKKAIKFEGQVDEISFTSFESLLHPQFCEIIELCRETHPKAKLWVITNGTIPIKGRYKKAISMLNKVGLSIDGASKEVFESIRIGAVFEDFIENTKAIVEIRKQTGSPEELTFAFTATSTNLHELIGVVRLAHSLGVPEVWAQAMESKDEFLSLKIDDILIDRLDPELRTALIVAAREDAKRLGVKFFFSEGLYPISSGIKEEGHDASHDLDSKSNLDSKADLDSKNDHNSIALSQIHDNVATSPLPQPLPHGEREASPPSGGGVGKGEVLSPIHGNTNNNDLYVKLCQYPWQQPAQVSEVADGYLVLPCCYMGYMDTSDLKYGLKLTEIKPMDEIYNSTAFWKFREDLMEGKTHDVCGNCQAARGYTWKPSRDAKS